jgi:hypothetical protein
MSVKRLLTIFAQEWLQLARRSREPMVLTQLKSSSTEMVLVKDRFKLKLFQS